jgi:hypothetical protein
MLALSLLTPLCLASEQKWKTFESKEWGFRVKYPKDWNVWNAGLKSIRGEDVFKFKCGYFELFRWTGEFEVQIGKANGKSPVQVYDEMLTEADLWGDPSYKEKRANSTLGGLSALEVVWIYKVPDPNEKGRYVFNQKGKTMLTVKGDEYYAVAFCVDPMEKYKEWIKIGDEMIFSFEFIEEK